MKMKYSLFFSYTNTHYILYYSKAVDIGEKERIDLKHAKELNRTRLYIEKLRKKLDVSQKKYKRLQEKATSLAFLVKQLQKKLPDKQSKEDV